MQASLHSTESSKDKLEGVESHPASKLTRNRSPVVSKYAKKWKKNSDIKHITKIKDYNDFHIKGHNQSFSKDITNQYSIQSISGLSEIRSLEDKIGEYTIEKTDEDTPISPMGRKRIEITDAVNAYQKSFTNLVTLNSPKASPIKSNKSSFGNFEF